MKIIMKILKQMMNENFWVIKELIKVKNLDLIRRFQMGILDGIKRNITLQLIDCDYAPENMAKQLPISCSLLRMIPGVDRLDYWLAKCECPVKYEESTVNYLILAPRFVGTEIKRGIESVVLNVAYVIDESLIQDATLDFDKCKYVAICNAIVR